MNDEIVVIEATTSEEDIVAVEKEEVPTIVVEAIEIPTVVLVGNALNINVSNEITTTTTTDLTGILKGNGSTIATATAGTDYVAPNGNAGTATTLATARAINGVDFNGSAAITVPVNNANDVSTDADVYLLWTATQGGNYAAKTSVGLKYHPSTGLLTAAGFSGPLTGNVTGTASGNLVSGGALGTPSSGTLTNCTFPTLNQDTTGSAVYWKTSGTGKGAISGPAAGTTRTYTFPDADATVLTSTASGVQTFLTTPSSANLASMVTDETGSGALVFGTTPTFTTSIICPLIKPASDSTTAFKITKADGATAVVTVDTTNSRMELPAGGLKCYNSLQVGYGTPPSYAIYQLVGENPANYNVMLLNSWPVNTNPGVSIGTTRTDGTAMQVVTNVGLDSNGMPNSVGTTVLEVLGNGNVLIGTTTDDTVNKLQVNGTISGTSFTGTAAGLSSTLVIGSGGTGSTTGSITGSGALTFAAGGSNQNVNLKPSGTGKIVILNSDGSVGFNINPGGNALNNIGIGVNTLISASLSGTANIAIGTSALSATTSGYNNVAIGYGAGASLTEGLGNFALGTNALTNNITGNNNIAVGSGALQLCTGSQNVAVGAAAVQFATSGSNITGVGYSALGGTVGSGNTALGAQAGYYYGTGSSLNQNGTTSIFVGYDARPAADSETNEIVIGYQGRGNGSNTVTIGNSSTTNNYFTGAIHAASLLATSNDSGALGASGTAFSDLFLASGGVINWNAGNATLTHSTGLLTSNVPLSVNAADAAIGLRVIGATGRLRLIGYLDSDNGAVVQSLNTAESSLLPITVNGSKVVLGLSGNVLINTTTDDTVNKLQINGSIKAGQAITLTNTTFTGIIMTASTSTSFGYNQYFNDGALVNYQYFFGSAYPTDGRYVAASFLIDACNAGGLGLAASNAAGNIVCYTNGSTERFRITNAGECTFAKRFNSAVSALTTGATVALNSSLGDYFTLTPDQSLQINASNAIAGQTIFLKILTSGTTSYTITFGTNFKSTGTLATGTSNAKIFNLVFACYDGTNFEEVSRTTAY